MRFGIVRLVLIVTLCAVDSVAVYADFDSVEASELSELVAPKRMDPVLKKSVILVANSDNNVTKRMRQMRKEKAAAREAEKTHDGAVAGDQKKGMLFPILSCGMMVLAPMTDSEGLFFAGAALCGVSLVHRFN